MFELFVFAITVVAIVIMSRAQDDGTDANVAMLMDEMANIQRNRTRQSTEQTVTRLENISEYALGVLKMYEAMSDDALCHARQIATNVGMSADDIDTARLSVGNLLINLRHIYENVISRYYQICYTAYDVGLEVGENDEFCEDHYMLKLIDLYDEADGTSTYIGTRLTEIETISVMLRM